MWARASAIGLVALALAACGGEGDVDLRVLAYEGYAEYGVNDPRVDWVTPFERASGCDVSVRVVHTSFELVDRVTHGGYDVASVSGDVARVLIGGREVVPLDLTRVPRYRDVYPSLRALDAARKGGRVYGVPHGRFAYVQVVRSDLRPQRKIAFYDSPVVIAENAIDLGYDEPFALDSAEFLVAVRRAAELRASVSAIWRDEVHAVADFTGGTTWSGFVPPRIAELLRRDQVPIEVLPPRLTARADAWMITRRARNLDCAYRWLDWILSPRVNAQAARHLSASPATPQACALMRCRNDERVWTRLVFWTTPKNWRDWFDAWAAIRS